MKLSRASTHTASWLKIIILVLILFFLPRGQGSREGGEGGREKGRKERRKGRRRLSYFGEAVSAEFGLAPSVFLVGSGGCSNLAAASGFLLFSPSICHDMQ